MADLEELLAQLRAVTLELRECVGSAQLARDLCSAFVARLTAAIDAAAARADHYSARALGHQESVQAAETFVEVFGEDVAFRTALEDCCEAALAELSRLVAARDAVRALAAAEARHRALSMGAPPHALWQQPRQPAVAEHVRSLCRRASVWVGAPCALANTACDDEDHQEMSAADKKVQHGPLPDRGDSKLEDSYASDAALECGRGGRSPYRSPGASSGPSESSPQQPAGASSGPSESSPQQPAGASSGPSESSPQQPAGASSGPSEGSPQHSAGASSSGSSHNAEEAAAGPSTAAEPESSQLAAEKAAAILRSRLGQSNLVKTPCCKEIDPSTRSEVLLVELWRLYARMCGALREHVSRLAAATARSERRARQLCGGYLAAARAQRLLASDLRAAARAARDELARFAQQLRVRAADTAAYDRLLGGATRAGWWRRGAAAAAAERRQRQLQLQQQRRELRRRLAGWWRDVAGDRARPGDSPADVLVARLLPPQSPAPQRAARPRTD